MRARTARGGFVLALTLLMVAPALRAAARAPGCTEATGDRCPDWSAVYDGGAGPGEFLGVDRPVAVETSPDGDTVFVTGRSAGDETGHDIVTIAYDAATGSQRWLARYAGAGKSYDESAGLSVAPGGSRVFVVGVENRSSARGRRSVAVAYDAATGQELWTITRPGISLLGYDAAIDSSPDRVYVALKETDPQGAAGLVVRALDAETGAEAWSGRQPLADSALGAFVTVAGDRVFAGATEGYGPANGDYIVAAFHAAGNGAVPGDHLWTARYTGPYGRDVLHALEAAADGSAVFATGESDGAWRTDAATVAFDAAGGTQRWVARFETVGWDAGYDVAAHDDRVYVAGTADEYDQMTFSANMIGSQDALLVAYDAASGEQEWFDLAGVPGFTDERSLAVDVAQDGRVYATGWSAPVFADYGPIGGGGGTFSKDGSTAHAFNTSTTSIATLAYSSDGTPEWSSRLAAVPDGTTLHAAGIAAAPDGSVYVTASLGQTYGDSAYQETRNYTDYLTLAYGS